MKLESQLQVSTASGVAPFTVNQATLVSNLNAQYHNGQLGSFYQDAGNLNAGTLLAARLPAFTGDASSTVGTVGLTLASVGTAGTYRSVTTDAKGRVTAGTNPTTLAGYGITDLVYGSTGSRNVWTVTNWNQTTYPNAHFLSSENSSTNGPSSDFIYGLQTAFHRDGASYRTQMVTELYSNPVSIWVRNSRDSDAFTSWAKLIHSLNYTSYPDATKLPLTGGTLSGALNGTTAAFSGAITQGGNQVVHAGNLSSYVMKYGGAPGVDLNTLTVSGVYRINNTEANRPTDWGQLLVMYGGSDTITQIYGQYDTGTLRTRSGNPTNVGGVGAYTAWRTLLADHNYSSYALPLTGGTLTGRLTASYTDGTSGWGSIQIDAAPTSGAAYIRANRATAATGEVGYAWATGGVNKWINYLNANSDTLGWYQGSASVMTLTTGGALTAASFSGLGTGLTGNAASLTAGAVPWSGITSKPTTLAGYALTDVAYGQAAYQSKSLDTVSTPGLYQYDGAFGGTKPPDNAANYRTVEIGDGSRFSQIAMPWNSENLYFRYKVNSTFTAWRTVIHDGNYTSYPDATKLPLTGGSLTGTLNGTSAGFSSTVVAAGQISANGGLSISGAMYQGVYARRQIALNGPGTSNFGNWKQFIRLWAATGAGANLFTLKISVRGTWNWSAVFGTVEAFYALYLPADSTIASVRDFRIVHVSGPATDNIRLGDAVIENGFVSIPVWCANTNGLEATVEQWNGSQILGTVTTAISEALPAFIAPNFRGGLTSDGNAVLHAGNVSTYALPIGGGNVTGNVGFGTASPYGKIDLGSTTGVKLFIYGNGGNVGYITGLGTDLSGSSALSFFTGIGRFEWVKGTGNYPYSAYTVQMTLDASSNLNVTGTITATNHIGPGTGLTGTATSLTAGAVPWSGITSKPTTLAGFGITDAAAINGASNQNFSAYAFYQYDWLRIMADSGIYWQSGTYAGWHIHPQAAWGMSFRSASTDCGLQLRRSDATLLGSLYSDGTSIGFLNASSGWGASFTIAGAMNRGSVPGSLVTGNISGSAGAVAWSGITSKPTTLSGFGITDALPLTGGTLTGNLIAPKIGVGGLNTSFDFYNNGTSYFNGVTTFDDQVNVSNGYSILFGSSRLHSTDTSFFLGGKVGIGTGSPIGLLEVRGANRLISNDGLLQVNSSDNAGIDLGGSISFGGVWSGANVTEWAQVSGRKETATSGEYGGYLDLATRPHGGLHISRIRITSVGNVGIGTTSPATKLAVNGVSSFGLSSKLSMIGLDINSGVTPTYVKIITTIPVASGAADFTVNIKGFIYGSQRTADISICWHYYNSTFYNAIAKSSGGWAPTIRLSAEGGFVAIVLSSPGYWPKFYVESMYSSAYNNQYASGWSWVDADATGSPIVTVPYASDFGNSFVMLTNGNVGINQTSPSYKLDVSGTGRFTGDLTVGTVVGAANSATLYANSSSYGSWKIGGTRNGWYGIEFESGSNLMMNSNEVGFHRNGYGWQLWWSAGTAYCHKGNPGGGTQATILDSSNVATYALPISGIPSGSDQYVNFRVIRNSNASGPDGMYIGYGNGNSGRTRIYGDGSTSGYIFPDASGNLFRSDGATYIHSSNYTSYPDATKLPLAGGALTGTLSIDTSGTGVTSTVAIKRSGQGVVNFGSYAGAWRSALQIQSNANDRMLFFVPPEADYQYGVIRSVNGGLKIDVGGTTGNVGGNAISIETSGAVSMPGTLNVVGAVTQNGNQVLHAGNYIGSYIAKETSYTTPINASGYSWVRIPYAAGYSFNDGQSPIEFYVTRSIFANGSSPYGGPTAKFIIQSMEWHNGQQMATVQYGERGDSASLGAANWITHAKVTNLAGGGYWMYLRLKTGTAAGVTYYIRRSAVGGQGLDPSQFEVTTDPGGAAVLYYGFNLISAGNEARFYRDGNQVLDAGNYTSYPDATKLPLAGGTLTGSITATNHIGPGTGLTGTASGLNIGGNANNITQYTVNQSVGTGNSPSFTGLSVINTITGSITGNAGTATSLANFTNQSGTRFSTDFNSIVTTGFFNGEATPANAPSGFTYAQLISAKGIDTGLQIAGGYTNDNLWFRGWGPSLTFTGWRKLLHDGNYGGYSTFSGVVSSASGGFQTATYVAGRNRIWTFGNADGYGINYYQGAGGISGNDVIGLNFGNATAALAQFQFLASGSLNATGTITATNFSGPGSNLTGTASSLTAGSANAIADGVVSTTAKLANSVVTYAKIQNVTAYTVLGNSSPSSAQAPVEISMATLAGMVGNQYTTSIGNTLPDRVFMSNDANIKFAPRDTAKAHLGLTGKYGNSRPNITGDTNYWVGSMGWGTTDWNSVFDWGSGFTDSWGGSANAPGDTSHHVGVQALHYTNGSSRYGWQMVNGAATNRWWLRDVWGGGFSAWREIIHSGNIASQTVATANSVAWTNVSGRPTAVSSFSNDSGYITSGGSISGSSGSCTGNAASVTDGVYLSTNQYISGVKTFSAPPVATNIAKAWVHYNMYNNTINASYNVSSVTDNGAGVCTVNFSSAMVDANYVVAGTATYDYDNQDIHTMVLAVPRRSTAQQAGSCRLATEYMHAAAVYDSVAVRAVFYR